MTYRSAQGLGAAVSPTLTDAQVAALFNGFFLEEQAAGGACKSSSAIAMQALTCLTKQHVELLGKCWGGVTPPGVSDLVFVSVTFRLGQCGLFNKLGCPEDDAALAAQIPNCLPTAAALEEMLPSIAYVKQYPAFNGPNKALNASAWIMSRYPKSKSKFLALALCAPAGPVAVPADVTAAVAKRKADALLVAQQQVVQQQAVQQQPETPTRIGPPPNDYTAQVTVDPTPPGASADSADAATNITTPGKTMEPHRVYTVEMVNGLQAVRNDYYGETNELEGTSYIYPGDPKYADALAAAGGGGATGAGAAAGTNYALWGLLGLAALGGGYMLLKKK